MKKRYLLGISFLLLGLFSFKGITNTNCENNNTSIIKSEDDFFEAIDQAIDGSVFYVDDIEFTAEKMNIASMDIYTPTRVSFNDSFTFKGVSSEKKAKFSNLTLGLSGSSLVEEAKTISFENISFEGLLDPSSSDNITLLAQNTNICSFFLSKCLNINFYNCDFTKYGFSGKGGIYGIYSSDDAILYKLNITFDRCRFFNNAGQRGSAMYFTGSNENVAIKVNNCEFFENYESYGTIFTDSCNLEIKDSRFYNNHFDHFGQYSTSGGGAIYVSGGTTNILSCSFNNNTGDLGGAIYSHNCNTKIDGCVFSGNHANNGGALCSINSSSCSVVCYNSTFNNNDGVLNGGVAVGGTTSSTGYTRFYLCTFHDNPSGSVDENYYADNDHSVLKYCLVSKDKDFNVKGNKDNNYNSFVKGTSNLVNKDGHLSLFDNNRSTILDNEIIKDVFAFRPKTLILGKFYSGDNCASKCTITFPKQKKYMTYSYGDKLTLPEASKKNYTFKGWITEDGITLSDYEYIVFAGNIELRLKSQYEINKDYLALVISLPSAAFIVIVGIVIFVIVFIKKQKLYREKFKEQLTSNSYNQEVLDKLSEKEKEVAFGLLDGKNRKELANELFVSENTIKKHIASIYLKLEVANRIQLSNVMKFGFDANKE